MDPMTLAERLIREHKVAVIPGTAFGHDATAATSASPTARCRRTRWPRGSAAWSAACGAFSLEACGGDSRLESPRMAAPPLGESSFSLIRRAKTGDAGALDALVGRYLKPLRRWARGRLPAWARDGMDTEDLVQESVVNSLKHLESFDPRRALAELGDDERALVVARVELGYSYEQIAVALDKPSADAARMAVGRALVKLAERMRLG